MSRGGSLRALLLAASLGLAASMAGAPADAVEASLGTKNFNPPGFVPNYFSNEGGSARGAGAGTAQAAGTPIVATPAARSESVASHPHARHLARQKTWAHGRFAVARGKAGPHHHVVRAHAARSGRPASRSHTAQAAGVNHARGQAVAAKGRSAPSKGRAIAAKGRPAPAKTKHPARARG